MNPDFFKPSHKKLIAADRFWKRVLVGSGSECWQWLGPLDKNGYGSFYLGTKGVRSHRASWMLHFGEIPNGLQVCHHCDNPTCVNPSHLFLGTGLDNMRDKTKKGRNNVSSGSKRADAKITESDVLLIRDMAKNTSLTYAEIGKKFDICPGNVCLIVKGQTWKHVAGSMQEKRLRRNEKQVELLVPEMRQLHKDGMSNANIARKFNISRSLVSLIIAGKKW